jgi:hypothetical protein
VVVMFDTSAIEQFTLCIGHVVLVVWGSSPAVFCILQFCDIVCFSLFLLNLLIADHSGHLSFTPQFPQLRHGDPRPSWERVLQYSES